VAPMTTSSPKISGKSNSRSSHHAPHPAKSPFFEVSIFKFPEPDKGRELDVGASIELIQELQRKTNSIIQLGITLASDESRMAVAKATSVEMFSISLADNDHYGMPYPPTIHRSRKEMENLAKFCLDEDIIPEWEVFHSGAAWNLHYLIKKGLAKPPYFVNMPFYPEGSSWSPRTFSEIDHRAAMLPEETIWHLSAFARSVDNPIIPPISVDENVRLLTYAILRGGHVRTGREDRMLGRESEAEEESEQDIVQGNAQLIREIIEIADRLGRPIASPVEARRMLGIGDAL